MSGMLSPVPAPAPTASALSTSAPGAGADCMWDINDREKTKYMEFFDMADVVRISIRFCFFIFLFFVFSHHIFLVECVVVECRTMTSSCRAPRPNRSLRSRV
jgi:hypothetical protein